MASKSKSSVLLIYTGGTIGMVENPETGALEPFNFRHIQEHIPELKRLGHKTASISFDPPMDSSDIGPDSWAKIVRLIADNYDAYDGFVVLHGTDTMAFTASALSFMLENLNKPVILTGSQLPINMLRTDGKENLITAIEIAAARDERGRPRVPEVSLFFENYLMRGNRTSKISADQFSAFESFNYPHLAYAGIDIRYHERSISRSEGIPLAVNKTFDPHVAILKLFPGITREVVEAILGIPTLKGVVLETFGSGNAPMTPWFLEALREAVARDIVIVNVTQCVTGYVEMQRYETGLLLQEIGLISGRDCTTESALTKLMYLLGRGYSTEEVKQQMGRSLRGELTLEPSDEAGGRVPLIYRH